MHLSQNGKDAARNFLDRLMTDGTKSVVGADFWSSSGHALLGVTGHGISSAWVLQFVLIGAIPCSTKSHTADLVDELLDESFRKLGFHNAHSAVFTSVSDNGSNMVAGLSAGGRFPCVCHTIELSVKKGCDIREISCVLKKASKLVAHFSRSTISASKLKDAQLQACLKRKKMIKMVLTRWRSHRDMSVSVVINRPALVAFFEENDCMVEDEGGPGKYLKMHLGTTDFKILDQFSGMLETMAQASQICEGDKYPTIGVALTALSMCISSMCPTTDITLSSQGSISDRLLEPCVRAARAAILRDLQERWIEQIDDNVRRILCIGAMLDPRFKTIKETAPEFTDSMLDMDSVFEFELMARWVPKEPEAASSVVKDTSTPTATNSSLTPTVSTVSGGISMSSFLARNK